jgi:ubiquinone/menaquinone biosynthesis C-methylase UbiE
MRRPRFIAEQARHARGFLGRFIATVMAGETWADNQRAVKALGVERGDHVLDLGCGPGRALSVLAALATAGRVVGVDPSGLMVKVALRRNRRLVRSGRVDVIMAPVEALPFKDASFDKLLCVHVIYFWPDLSGALGEVARVVKTGGSVVFLFRTDADRKAVRAFPAEVYRFSPLTVVVAALERAGFDVESADAGTGRGRARPALLVATRSRR